jgi:hypothetical protein
MQRLLVFIIDMESFPRKFSKFCDWYVHAIRKSIVDLQYLGPIFSCFFILALLFKKTITFLLSGFGVVKLDLKTKSQSGVVSLVFLFL